MDQVYVLAVIQIISALLMFISAICVNAHQWQNRLVFKLLPAVFGNVLLFIAVGQIMGWDVR